jgi:hypothetical protein
VVVVGQLLPLVEHVLLEDAFVVPRHRDRAGVVEAAHVVRVRELDDVLRALDVRLLRGLLVGLHVIDGGQMEEVVDLLVEPVDPEALLREVAGHGDDPAVVGVQPLRERIQLAARALAHERVDGPVSLQ